MPNHGRFSYRARGGRQTRWDGPSRFQHRHMGPQRAHHAYQHHQGYHQPRLDFCNVCHISVQNIGLHAAKRHNLKYWGFQCPHCGYFEGRYDKGNMEKHLRNHLNNQVAAKECMVAVQKGYTDVVRCLLCDWKGVSVIAVAQHTTDVHPEQAIESYSTRSLRSREEVVDPSQFPEAFVPKPNITASTTTITSVEQPPCQGSHSHYVQL